MQLLRSYLCLISIPKMGKIIEWRWLWVIVKLKRWITCNALQSSNILCRSGVLELVCSFERSMNFIEI